VSVPWAVILFLATVAQPFFGLCLIGLTIYTAVKYWGSANSPPATSRRLVAWRPKAGETPVFCLRAYLVAIALSAVFVGGLVYWADATT
jgi:hypothetical protein